MGPGAGVGASRCGVLVLGGGVCGLWTLHALLAAGHDAWLLEKRALGDGQTIASQGILHAGAKYRLPGNAMDASRAVADVQGVWREALRGGAGSEKHARDGRGTKIKGDDRDGRGTEEGTPDLSGVRIIDRRTVLWTRPTLGSAAAAAGAQGVMRSEVHRLPRKQWPLGFESAPRGVRVYETAEAVLEPASLLGCLREGVAGRVRIGEVRAIDGHDDGIALTLANGTRIVAGCAVLCAGEGNAALLGMAGEDGASMMQRRPLHQLVALPTPFALNGHCLKLDLDKPELTVTTGELDGRRTWYFGGGPAEDGVGRSAAAQLEAGRAAVRRCLPWVDQTSFEWRVFTIDRAEGRCGGERPDDAVAVWAGDAGSSRVLAVWPTKLVLAPRAASLVVERLRARGIEPGGTDDGAGERAREGAVVSALPEPDVAERVW